MAMPINTLCNAEAAARAIIELINSRPTSPRQEEIVAIIRRLSAEATPVPPAARDGLDEYGPVTTP
jgi:hypothetical protein